MIVTVQEDTKPKFQPITLTITLESEDELTDLANRLNQSWSNVYRASPFYFGRVVEVHNSPGKIFDVVFELCKARGLYFEEGVRD